MTFSNKVHVVDPDSRRRAHIAFQLAGSALSAEVYENLEELESFSPETGFVLLNVDDSDEPLRNLTDYFREQSNFLPVAVYSTSLDVRQVVECLQSGAADYLVWPVSAADIVSTIERSVGRARASMLENTRRASAYSKVAALTPRERQVLAGVVEGMSNKAIGDYFGISARTVEVHRANTLRKLGVCTTVEAVRTAIYAGVEFDVP
jgi:two-component system, LuxR family, response regulator FixJ